MRTQEFFWSTSIEDPELRAAARAAWITHVLTNEIGSAKIASVEPVEIDPPRPHRMFDTESPPSPPPPRTYKLIVRRED